MQQRNIHRFINSKINSNLNSFALKKNRTYIKYFISILFLIIYLFILQPTGYADSTKSGSEADEFLPFDSQEESLNPEDEFSEFEEYEESEKSEEQQIVSDDTNQNKKHNRFPIWALIGLGFTILAGIFVRFKVTRKFRLLFLLLSLIVLGFYSGGCPCPISSFQHLILGALGSEVHWQNLIWFLGLIPLTYLFGCVWCGWVCHLGALQEFIFKSSKLNFLKSETAQKVMKILRYILFVVLIVQLLITQTNLFKPIDPFRVAFNLTSLYTTGWILLAILLLSSLFIYRPFCKSACPIGLILGFIKKIPGASIIGTSEDCNGCSVCINSCNMQAIRKNEKCLVLDNQDCIDCGECLD